MGQPSSDLIISPLSDVAIHIASIQGMKIRGNLCLFSNSILISLLALKNRINKNQKQRIIAFVASPLK